MLAAALVTFLVATVAIGYVAAAGMYLAGIRSRPANPATPFIVCALVGVVPLSLLATIAFFGPV